MKGNPPQFVGEYDPEAWEKWLHEVEKVFVVMLCCEEQKVTYFAFMLVGTAKAWKRNKQRPLEAEEQVIIWELFRECFLEKYFPKSVKNEKEKEFMSLKQGNMIVGEYAIRFEDLLKFFLYYQIHPDEEWVCRRFEDGLRPELKRAMLPLELNQFPALVEKYIVLESHDKAKSEMHCSRESLQGFSGPVGGGFNLRGRGGRFQQMTKP